MLPSVVTPTVAESFTAADVYKVQNALPARFSAGASWMASLAVLNSTRQFETTNGHVKFGELSMNPPTLLGRNVYENSNLDSTYDAAATAANYLLLYGDFKQFCITDRIGSRVELIDNLVGSSHRPTGQRGAFLWARVGSDSLIDGAFRVLNIATTA